MRRAPGLPRALSACNFLFAVITLALAAVGLSGTSGESATIQATPWLTDDLNVKIEQPGPPVESIDIKTRVSINLKAVDIHFKVDGTVGGTDIKHDSDTTEDIDKIPSVGLGINNYSEKKRVLYGMLSLGFAFTVFQFFAASLLLCLPKPSVAALAGAVSAFLAFVFLLTGWAYYIDQVYKPVKSTIDNAESEVTIPGGYHLEQPKFGAGLNATIAASWFAFASIFTAAVTLARASPTHSAPPHPP